jgi:hypothetical protein
VRELILSDITVMGQGHCVIGLEQTAQGAFHSVRPMPQRSHAWPAFFPYGRGSIIRFSAAATPVSPPHLEDQNTHGLAPSGEEVGEVKLVEMLRRAEVSANLQELFGSQLRLDTQGGNAWADPNSATRSICGCDFRNIRFRVYSERGEVSLRAKLLLPSGEVLNSLPIVDREWRRFFNEFVRHSSQTGNPPDLETLLNQSIRSQLMQAPSRFARIGLARGRPEEAKCWLMLDSLFPQPNAAWLSQ